MTRSPFHISSWVFSALTLSVVGLTPLCASGAQEIGGATRLDTAVPMAPGDDRINLQSLIEEMSARSPEIKAARERWEAAKEAARYSTAFGTLALLKAVKPRRSESQ